MTRTQDWKTKSLQKSSQQSFRNCQFSHNSSEPHVALLVSPATEKETQALNHNNQGILLLISKMSAYFLKLQMRTIFEFQAHTCTGPSIVLLPGCDWRAQRSLEGPPLTTSFLVVQCRDAERCPIARVDNGLCTNKHPITQFMCKFKSGNRKANQGKNTREIAAYHRV